MEWGCIRRFSAGGTRHQHPRALFPEVARSLEPVFSCASTLKRSILSNATLLFRSTSINLALCLQMRVARPALARRAPFASAERSFPFSVLRSLFTRQLLVFTLSLRGGPVFPGSYSTMAGAQPVPHHARRRRHLRPAFAPLGLVEPCLPGKVPERGL